MNERTGGGVGSMVVSGVIAALIGVVIVFIMSFILPFPWDLTQTAISVGLASFFGGLFSYRSAATK